MKTILKPVTHRVGRGRLLHDAAHVPMPKIRAGHERERAVQRGARARKAEADSDPQRRDGVVAFDGGPENLLECRTLVDLLQRPLLKRHES